MGWILRLQNFPTILYIRYRLDEENPYTQKNIYALFWMSYAMFVGVALKKKEDATFFILYVVVSASPLSGRFQFFRIFPISRPIPAFNADIPAFNAQIPCYLGFYVRYHARCATGGGEGVP